MPPRSPCSARGPVVVLNGAPANKAELRGYGFIDETIRFKRRWLTAEADAVGGLPALRKAVRDVTAAIS